jgi:hypothetical protein
MARIVIGVMMLIISSTVLSGCFSMSAFLGAEDTIDRDRDIIEKSEKARHKVPLWSWLQEFEDFRIIDLPIIPGSHNSASSKPRRDTNGPLYASSRQQELSISQQLYSGVRLIDLRLRYVAKEDKSAAVKLSLAPAAEDEEEESTWATNIVVSHTYDSSYTLATALQEMFDFLEKNPSEFVILLLRADWKYDEKFSRDEEKADRVHALSTVLKGSKLSFAGGSQVGFDSRVKDVQGKVLLVSRWLHEDPDRNTDLLTANGVNHFVWEQVYKVCDLWEDKNPQLASDKLDAFMKRTDFFRGLGTSIEAQIQDGDSFICNAMPRSALFIGVALDRTDTPVPPCIRSPQWTRWFLENLESNKQWRSNKRNSSNQFTPIGVVLSDFVNPITMKRLLEVGFRMAGKPDLRASFDLKVFNSFDLKCFYRK